VSLSLSPDDYLWLAAILVLVVVGKLTRSETRSMLAGVIAAIVIDSPAGVAAVALLMVVTKGFDVIWSG